MDPLVLLGLAAFGGWTAIDATSCGQFMLSRPLVAAPLAGAMVGDPVAGALMGLVLEAFHLAVLPVGAAKYPEGGPPAVVAGAAFAASGGTTAALFSVLLFALAFEWVASESVRLLRQVNVGLFSVRSATIATPVELERRHLAAIGLDFVRGAVLVALGLGLLSLLLAPAQAAWGLGGVVTEVLRIAVLVGLLASSARLFVGRLRLFLLGAAAGLLLLLVRG